MKNARPVAMNLYGIFGMHVQLTTNPTFAFNQYKAQKFEYIKNKSQFRQYLIKIKVVNYQVVGLPISLYVVQYFPKER